MNWESGIFCKLYKTNKYKFNPPNYLNLNENSKSSLKTIIEKQLKELYLDKPDLFGFDLNINLNTNQCCLYNLSPDNKNYYFSYLIFYIIFSLLF